MECFERICSGLLVLVIFNIGESGMKTKSELEENLSRFYLRLNGYFVTNLIIHSSKDGLSSSELDVVAIRFPFHRQPDRGVETSKYLDVHASRTEILLADVKGGKNLTFNDGLRKSKDSVFRLLRWIGIFNEGEIDKYLPDIHHHLNDIHRSPKNEFRTIDLDLKSGFYRIKLTFFAYNKVAPLAGDLKYIYSEEVLSYCWACLNTTEVVEDCSRQYDYKGWGQFEAFVRFFKESKAVPGSMEMLYDSMGIKK
jgi:hypothetical protein